jgi:cobalt-zinc-cadmium efflux system outer membrane protein
LSYFQDQYRGAIVNQPNFELVYSGVVQNFQKRNISLIEFTDFIESYNQSVLFLDEMEMQIMIQGERINYIVSQPVFK